MRRIVVFTCGAVLALLEASAAVVINEIHYNPDVKTEPAEFIELHNSGTDAVNLSGWYFSDGINYTFPSVSIPAGGYVVVAQNPAFLQTKYGVTGALGPFNPDGSSGISSRGEKLTLRNAAGQMQDEVEFQLGFPWPTVGDSITPGSGNSIELIHPSLDNNLGGSWRASGSGAGGMPLTSTTLLAASNVWKYIKGTSEASTPTTVWRQPGFDDSAWTSGALPIGYGETFLTTTLADMNGLYTSVFLRKQFSVTDPNAFNRLVLEAQYDDGFKMWINGTLVVDNTANMPAGEVPFNGTAVVSFEQGTFASVNMVGNPLAALVPGVNTIAVQAHNSALTGSSDFFFDARLIGQSGGSGGSGGSGPSPGRVNTVFAQNAPPQIRQVEHIPEQPKGGEVVKITAKVTDPDGVASVVLQYQIVEPGNYIDLADAAYTNAANWISLSMNDGGVNGDAVAGDDVFTAQLPASVQIHRRLIRYRITGADTGGRSVRVPYTDDPQPNFAYFVYNGVPAWTGAVQPGGAGSNGVVRTIPAAEMGRLPTFHLIAKSNNVATATWFERYTGDLYKWGGTLVYDGKVYDHIRYRARGGVWRYSMTKNMWKIDLNRGHDIEIRDNWGRKFKTPWTKINLGANIQQRDFWHRGEQGMYESVGMRVFQLADVAAPHTSFVTLRVIDDAQEQAPNTQYEGDFWGMYLAIEQENGRFLEEHDLPDSNLYKMEGGTGELNSLGPNGPTDKSDLNYILNNYTGKSESWWRTNWNLPRYYSYQAVAQAIHHYDICYDKNFFYYFNSSNRLWEICSWDLDLTWANNMYDAGCGGKDRVYQRIFDEASPAKPNIRIEWNNRIREFRDLLWNSDEAFKLIDEYAALARGSSTLSNILDADRMMWDYNPKMNSSTYSQNVGKAGTGEFYQFSQERGTNAALQGSFAAGVQIMKNYVGIRGAFLDSIALDNTKPNRPTIAYTGSPSYPVNSLTFRSSAYSGANAFASMRWRVGEITDTNAPNYRADEPRKYEIETVWDSSPITAFNADITVPASALRVGSRYRVRVRHTDTTGRDSQWSVAHEFTCGEPVNQADLLAYLRITELMFNPPAAGYEYVELYNSSSTVTLDLSGVKFTQGIDYTFAQGTTMPPGGFIVLAGTANIAAFRAYYGLDGSVTVLGPFSGNLNNAGEQLVLRTSAGGTDIVNFNYGDGRGWPPQADGTGHSLVLLDSALAAQGSGAGEYAGNWRASTTLRGSPGRADAVAPAGIVLNEIAANTLPEGGFDSNDWIELYNTTDAPITLGPGWYLSDDGGSEASLKKWQIPASTTIPARGFESFDEVTGFHNPTNIGFGLSKGGDEVLLSYLPGNAQDRVVDAVSFKGQENGWSLGRYPDGGSYWYALRPQTRGAANGPGGGGLINEIMYHPPDVLVGTNATDNSLDEFIELYNANDGTIPFFTTSGTWRLNGGVDFVFPTNVTLAGGKHLLIVNFDPETNAVQLAAFKSLYGITDPSLRIFGPYTGKLANNSDRIALELPRHFDSTNGAVSWVVVDEVLYADQAPWPCGSDGSGNSLQRLSALQHGSDPLNWSAEPPTAGRARENLPAGLPAITAQPQDRVAPTNGNVSFSVSVCGTPPFTYQWRFSGVDITGATNATLNLLNVTPASAGFYSVVVANAAGSITSADASLIVQFPPIITVHPQPTTTIRDQSAMFSVTVGGGTPPFAYQWQFAGVNIIGATNTTLLLTNVQAGQAGNYAVRVSNTAGSVVSANALLTVLIPATITQPPTNRTVTATYNTNGYYNPTGATFTVVAVGTGTLRYQWRFNGADIPGGTNATLMVTNITPANEGAYSALVNDNIGPALSPAATLTVLTPPVFLSLPPNQSVVQGGDVMLSAAIEAHPPPFTFEWRRGSVLIASNVTSQKTAFFNLTNVQFTTNASLNITGAYRVVAKNLANSSPGVLGNPTTTILALPDTDGDGIPDAWESTYGSGTTSLAPDADLDGDGMKNRDEYIAGTDPTNALSYLRVENIQSTTSAAQLVQIEFNAVSNRTYSVLYSEQPGGPGWSRVADVVAVSTNRVLRVFDQRPVSAPPRYYRLVTPRNP